MPPRRRAKPPEWRREGVRRTIFPLRKDKIRPKIAKIREIGRDLYRIRQAAPLP